MKRSNDLEIQRSRDLEMRPRGGQDVYKRSRLDTYALADAVVGGELGGVLLRGLPIFGVAWRAA